MASLYSHRTLICLLLCIITSVASVPNVRDMSIDEYINYINPPAVHKYRDKHGDSILCVAYADQISLQGSEQRSRKPMYDRKMKSEHNFSSYGVKTNCPEGTVAVMETKREQVERAGSVANFISKPRNIAHSSKGLDASNGQHEYAVVQYQTTNRIGGAEAGLNVWQPVVDTDRDGVFSLSQIWVINGGGSDPLETIEVGWMVYPQLLGDALTRLFTYWTTDGYQNTGCYNTFCPGFVLAPDAAYHPGEALQPMSEYNGNQVQIIVGVMMEEGDDDEYGWSLYVDNKLIGWWPSSLYTNLASVANRLDLGGEVTFKSTPPGTPFMKTQMGSGHFPSEGFGRAAIIRDIQIFNGEQTPIDDITPRLFRGRPNCYDVSVNNDNGETYIYYGGPGGNDLECVV